MSTRPSLPIIAMLACTCACSVSAQTWCDGSRATQFSAWGERANWREGIVPNAAGATAHVDTAGASKYITLREPVVLGRLEMTGTDCPPAALLSEGEGRFLFDAGDETAAICYEREGRDMWDVPVTFRRALLVQIGVREPETKARILPPTKTSLYIGKKASFVPLSNEVSGIADLTFRVHSRIQPWTQTQILEHRQQNVVEGFLEDAEEGAALRVRKEGRGTLSFTSGDNGYSGGTVLAEGVLCAVNGPNLDSPVLPFGTGPLTCTGEAEIALMSSRDAVWGPDQGYPVEFAAGGTLSLGSATAWNSLAPPRGTIIRHQLASLSIGGTRVVVRERNPSELCITGPLELRSPRTTLHVVTTHGCPFEIPTLRLLGPLTERADTSALLRKTGSGMLYLSAPSHLSGGLDIVEGSLSVASHESLGSGPITVYPGAILVLRQRGFVAPSTLQQKPDSIELWQNEETRLGPHAPASVTMPQGVHLYLGGDLLEPENQTLILSGGRLGAWRNPSEPDPTTHIIGSRLCLATTEDLLLGSIPPKEVFRSFLPFLAQQNATHPLDVRCPIRELQPGCSLVKVGYDTLALRSIATLSGGTRVEAGTLAVYPSARLPTGPVTIAWTGPLSGGKPLGEARLRLISPDSFPEGSPISLGPGAILELPFEGHIGTSLLTIGLRSFGPGIYSSSDFPAIQGPGAIVVYDP